MPHQEGTSMQVHSPYPSNHKSSASMVPVETKSSGDGTADRLHELLGNPMQVLAAIEDDPSLWLDSSEKKPNHLALQELKQRDVEVTKTLQQHLRLKIVADLLIKYNSEIQCAEFTAAFETLRQCVQKAKSADVSAHGVRFEQAFNTYLSGLHAVFVRKLQGLLEEVWHIHDDGFSFQQQVSEKLDDAREHNFDYDSLVDMFSSCFVKDGDIDERSWFFKNISMPDVRDDVKQCVNSTYNNYIKLSQVKENLKGFLFSDSLRISCSGTRLHVDQGCETPAAKVESYVVLADYLLNVLSPVASNQILMTLGGAIVTEATKVLKQHSKELLSKEANQKKDLAHFNDTLVKLSSRKGSSWTYNGNALDKLLNDPETFATLMFEQHVHLHLLKLRELFSTDNWSQLIEVKQPASAETDKAANSTVKSQKRESKSMSTNEWEWNENDDEGWNAEFDTEINSEEHRLSDSKDKGVLVEEDQNNADGWDDVWDDDVLDLESITQDVIQITKIPDGFQKVLESFEKGAENLNKDFVSAEYAYKFNLLQTAFFAMCMSKYNDWWLLVRDMKYIISQCDEQTLYQLSELTARFTENNIATMRKAVFNMLQEQLNNLKANELSPNWDVTRNSLLPFIHDEVQPAFERLSDQSVLLNFLKFLYNDCLVNEILQWNIISEKNSENLSELIHMIYNGTKFSALQDNNDYKHARTKLAIIALILKAHLKDIMDMFYNGDFFLFSTEEIIQWILLLFADTHMRRDCIYEVRTIRQESEE
ncbi:FAFR652Wp [Eremothecium gossypii FDAG1]|nr:FAFR652Wp [Eremothecium gossypii FDAG1]